LQRPLGEGGAGAVYLALDRETGEEVALKKLLRMDLSRVSRLKREFRALADFHHPNLVKLFDLQRADDAWFLTMEFVDGKDLRSSLLEARDQRATRHDSNWIPRVASAFHRLALGVCALHAAGMLHRDLKPSNVIRSKRSENRQLELGVRACGRAVRAMPDAHGGHRAISRLCGSSSDQRWRDAGLARELSMRI
jgi:serine/threonine protein kinase